MARLDYRLPDIGEGLADVEVVKWLVRDGDTTRENDPIAEVETDKAVVTIPAPASGRVTGLAVKEGERVKVGAVLLTMEIDAVAAAPATAGDAGAASVREAAPAPAAPSGTAGPRAAPAVRKLALDLGVRLEDVTPTGMGGRVTFDDVKRHASERSRGATAAPAAQAVEVEVERVPLRGSADVSRTR